MVIRIKVGYLLTSVALVVSPTYRQCRPAPVSGKQDSGRVYCINTLEGLSDMLRIIICYQLNSVAVQYAPTYRQSIPAPVSSRQDSGKAGPENSVLSLHKSRIYLICSFRAIIWYLLNIAALYISPTYRQCRPDPVSSQQESGRAGPERSVLFNT